MNVDSFIEGLEALAEEDFRLQLDRFAVPSSKAIGVRMPKLRDYVKPFKGDLELAQGLFESPYHEAKLATALIYPGKELSSEQADRFMEGLYSWDLVDQFCGNLFQKAAFASELPFLWAPLPGEFQRRSGLVMILAISIHHKNVADQELLKYLPLVREFISDDRNFVKKANSWVLRTLGKRSPWLNAQIRGYIEREWQIEDGKFQFWAASDAHRELRDPKMMARIEKQAARRQKG